MRNAITLPATATAQVVTLVTEIIIEPLPRTPTLAAQPEVTHKSLIEHDTKSTVF